MSVSTGQQSAVGSQQSTVQAKMHLDFGPGNGLADALYPD